MKSVEQEIYSFRLEAMDEVNNILIISEELKTTW